jgi:hypothetical protein
MSFACVFIRTKCTILGIVASCHSRAHALKRCGCSQGEEPGTAQTNDKKETKTVNLEQEMLKRRKIIIHGPIDDRLAYTVCMKVFPPHTPDSVSSAEARSYDPVLLLNCSSSHILGTNSQDGISFFSSAHVSGYGGPWQANRDDDQ